MKRITMSFAVLALVAAAACQASAQNLIANPGFELPTVDMGSSLGNWFRFGSGAGGTSSDDTSMPRTGSGNIELSVVGANQFAGIFQKLPGTISPGQILTFSGWAKSAFEPFAATQEIKIEWTGAPTNQLNVLTLPTTYTQFTHTAVAPAGTTGATVTYAIATFGPGQGDSVVFLDDFSATVIPEPATVGLLLVGLAGIGVLRRRK